jgi:polyisoprenoid-binding protein YceI
MSARSKVIVGSLVVVALLVGGGLWWFFRDDAPPEANLETAVAALNDSTGTSTSAADDASIDGTWTVDTSSGTFDYDSATGTFAGFRIQENLASIGSTTAVGRTGDVSGSMTVAGSKVTAATFTVDLTTIRTNQSQRDSRVQSALATSSYPDATFTLASPVELGPDAASGQKVSATAVGDLTIHGVTERVEIPLDAQLTNGTVVVVGSIDITFSDFGVSVPQSPAVVSVDDHGQMEVQLLLTRS